MNKKYSDVNVKIIVAKNPDWRLKMKEKQILITILLFMNVLNVKAQNIPSIPDLSKNVKAELIDMLNIVFEDDKQKYGFTNTDSIRQVIMSKPFKLYFIPENYLEIIKTCTDMKDMINKGYLNYEIYALLSINARPICLASIYHKEDGYHVGGITATKLINNLNSVLTFCQNPIIVSSYLKSDWYFSDDIDNYTRRYPLKGALPNGLGKTALNIKQLHTFLDEIQQAKDMAGENR